MNFFNSTRYTAWGVFARRGGWGQPGELARLGRGVIIQQHRVCPAIDPLQAEMQRAVPVSLPIEMGLWSENFSPESVFPRTFTATFKATSHPLSGAAAFFGNESEVQGSISAFGLQI